MGLLGRGWGREGGWKKRFSLALTMVEGLAGNAGLDCLFDFLVNAQKPCLLLNQLFGFNNALM